MLNADVEIGLQWKDNSDDELGFLIERSVSGEKFAPFASVEANVTHFTADDLKMGESYDFRIRAYNAEGSSRPTESATFSTSGLHYFSPIDDQTIPVNSNTAVIPFDIFDFDAFSDEIEFSARSSNEDLVPIESIAINSALAKGTVEIVPNADKSGSSRISIIGKVNGKRYVSSFTISVGSDLPPGISDIEDVNGFEGVPLPPVTFSLSDDINDPEEMDISIRSSNTQLVQSTGYSITQNGDEFSILLPKTPQGSGQSEIFITVKDQQNEVTESFYVNVAENTKPIISLNNYQLLEIPVNQESQEIEFILDDLESPIEDLALTVRSHNEDLVSTEGISITGTTNQRVLKISPNDNMGGYAIISIQANDPSKSTLRYVGVKVESDLYFTKQPSDSLVELNAPATFEASAIGIDLEYEWYHESISGSITPIENSNEPVLSLDSISSNGTYWVEIRNGIEAPVGRSIQSRPVAVITLDDSKFFRLNISGTDQIIEAYLRPDESVALFGRINSIEIPVTAQNLSKDGLGIYRFLVPQAGLINLSLSETRLEGTFESFSDDETYSVSGSEVETEQPFYKFAGSYKAASNVFSDGKVDLFLSRDGTGTVVILRKGVRESLKVTTDITGRISTTSNSGLQIQLEVDALHRTLSGTIVDEIFEYTLTNSDASVVQYLGTYHAVGTPFREGRIDLAVSSNGVASISLLRNGISESLSALIDPNGHLSATTSDGSLINLDVDDIEKTVSGSISNSGIEYPVSGSNLPESQFVGAYNFVAAASQDGEVELTILPNGSASINLLLDGINQEFSSTIDSSGNLSAVSENGIGVELYITSFDRIISGTLIDGDDVYQLVGYPKSSWLPGRLSNISIRSKLNESNGRTVAGVVISSATPEPILIRGIGPTLGAFGVPTAIPDPTLELLKLQAGNSPEIVARNDKWYLAENSFEIKSASSNLGAFPLGAASDDAAILSLFSPGSYSIRLSDSLVTSGSNLIEIYDARLQEEPYLSPILSNVSFKARLGTDMTQASAGMVIAGNSPVKLLMRVVGPELANFGIANALADPRLSLFRNENGALNLVVDNEDWDASNVAVTAATQALGAFTLSDGSKSSAIVRWLEPGIYTIQANADFLQGDGTALLEAYTLPLDFDIGSS